MLYLIYVVAVIFYR